VTPVAYSVFDDIGRTAWWRKHVGNVLAYPFHTTRRVRAAFARRRAAESEGDAPDTPAEDTVSAGGD
jgi:hypothetical protein